MIYGSDDYNNKESIYSIEEINAKIDELNSLLSSINSNAFTAIKSCIPSLDNTYDLGYYESKDSPNNRMFRNIFTHSLQIGEEGEDWYIGDNSGYLILQNRTAFEWGKVEGKGSESTWQTVNFPLPFTKVFCITTGQSYKEMTTESGHGYIRKGYYSGTSMQIETLMTGCFTFWMAIGNVS